MSYAFILTDAILDDESPLELIDGHVLAKATTDQINEIRDFLKSNIGVIHYIIPYQHDRVPHEDGKGYSFPPLDFEKWRYRVINYDGPNTHLYDLDSALSLCKQELEIGPSRVTQGERGTYWVSHAQMMSSFFADSGNTLQGPRHIEAASLKCCRDYFKKLETTAKTKPAIQRTLTEFINLRTLPRDSPFVILGCFMILESLITHAPKPSDSGDSLTRQIRAKMALLERRFCRELPWDVFRDEPHDKVWSKLYSYRSLIAHGGQVDFKSSEISTLKGEEAVRSFMREAVKLILIQALEEPQLILDLQQC